MSWPAMIVSSPPPTTEPPETTTTSTTVPPTTSTVPGSMNGSEATAYHLGIIGPLLLAILVAGLTARTISS